MGRETHGAGWASSTGEQAGQAAVLAEAQVGELGREEFTGCRLCRRAPEFDESMKPKKKKNWILGPGTV